MVFSKICVAFHQLAVEHVRSEHPKNLGSFLLASFRNLDELDGADRRYAQALGREMFGYSTQHLVQHQPEMLGPLAQLLQDKFGNGSQRKRGLCFNSDVVRHTASMMLQVYHRFYPLTVGGFLWAITRQLKSGWSNKEFNLYRPLARRLIASVAPHRLAITALQTANITLSNKPLGVLIQRAKGPSDLGIQQDILSLGPPPYTVFSGDHVVEVTDAEMLRYHLSGVDRDALQAAWTAVKKRGQKPLWNEDLGVPVGNLPNPTPEKTTEDEPLSSEDEPSYPNSLVQRDIDQMLEAEDEYVEVGEGPLKVGEHLDIVPEKAATYQHILQSPNDPAFIDGMIHPKYGEIFVMVSCAGSNSEGSLVYRGGLIWVAKDRKGNPVHKDALHRHMAPLSIIGSVSWRDGANGAFCARGIRWVKGSYGKYWTNVKSNDPSSRWGDEEHLKRWFKLGDFPNIVFFSGRAEYDSYCRRFLRALEKRKTKKCSASTPPSAPHPG
jgi:hypothetical protein